jgi:hypothetical protein
MKREKLKRQLRRDEAVPADRFFIEHLAALEGMQYKRERLLSNLAQYLLADDEATK